MKFKKVIAITANTSWYLYNFRKNTILSLLKQGYSVVTIAPRDDYSQKLMELGATYIPISIDSGGTNPINDLVTFYAFYQIYKKHEATQHMHITF